MIHLLHTWSKWVHHDWGYERVNAGTVRRTEVLRRVCPECGRVQYLEVGVGKA